MQLFAHRSELGAMEAAQKVIAERENILDEKHQQNIAKLENAVGACVNDHTKTQFAAIHADLVKIMESSQKQQELFIEKRLQQQFRKARDQGMQATHTLVQSESKRAADEIEARFEERLQHTEQQHSQENQVLRGEVETLERDVAIASQSAEALHKQRQREVITQCATYVKGIEARLQKCSSRAQVQAKECGAADKLLKETITAMTPQIEAVVKQAFAREIRANRDRLLDGYNCEAAASNVQQLKNKKRVSFSGGGRTEQAIGQTKAAKAAFRRKVIAATRTAERSSHDVETRSISKLEKDREEALLRLELQIKRRTEALQQNK